MLASPQKWEAVKQEVNYEIVSQTINRLLNSDIKTIILLTHTAPDLDALGSIFAMARIVKSYGKEDVYVYLPELNCYQLSNKAKNYINGIKIISTLPKQTSDLAIVLDCNDYTRMGIDSGNRKLAEFVVNIDHHSPIRNWGTHNIVDPTAASTTVVIYKLFHRKLQRDLDNETANLIRIGILGDTQGGRNNRWTSEARKITKELQRKWKIDYNGNLFKAFKRNINFRLVSKLTRIFERRLEGCGNKIGTVYIKTALLGHISIDEFIPVWRIARNKFQKMNKIGIFVNFVECDEDKMLRVSISCSSCKKNETNIDAAQICFKLGKMFHSPIEGGGHEGCASVKFPMPRSGITLVKKITLREINKSFKRKRQQNLQ